MFSAFSRKGTFERPPIPGSDGPIPAILITLGTYFGSAIYGSIIALPLFALVGQFTHQNIQQVSESTVGQFLFIGIVEVLTLAILYVFLTTCRIPFASIGLGRRPRLGDLGNALVCTVVYFAVLIAVMRLVELFVPAVNVDQEQQIGFKSATDPIALALVFVSLVVLPPIVEEITVRGFLYSGLRKKTTKIIAALGASLLFAAAHLQLGSGAPPLYVAAIDTFILSMFLIVLRERTGSLWAGILVHAFKNGIAFLALFVFKS